MSQSECSQVQGFSNLERRCTICKRFPLCDDEECFNSENHINFKRKPTLIKEI